MADAATEIDLDSVIDRLLEGEPASTSFMQSGAGGHDRLGDGKDGSMQGLCDVFIS
jgi:hypothetical protein